jgi:hypothetical protein
MGTDASIASFGVGILITEDFWVCNRVLSKGDSRFRLVRFLVNFPTKPGDPYLLRC